MTKVLLQNQTATIGTKYQVVIPREVRKHLNWVEPGKKVELIPLGQTVSIRPVRSRKKKPWTERALGAHKKIWQGVDVLEYIRDLRNEE